MKDVLAQLLLAQLTGSLSDPIHLPLKVLEGALTRDSADWSLICGIDETAGLGFPSLINHRLTEETATARSLE